MDIFGIPLQAFMGQLMLGLVNGAFYAMLSLGLAVIFGLLGIVNFAHGALYMLGAFAAWIMLDLFGINYWAALFLAPLIVGILGVVIERLFLKHLYKLDPLYGLLLTFGLSLIAEGIFRELYGVSPELRRTRVAVGCHQPRLHGAAQLPCMGGAGVRGRLPRYLVFD